MNRDYKYRNTFSNVAETLKSRASWRHARFKSERDWMRLSVRISVRLNTVPATLSRNKTTRLTLVPANP